MDLICVRVKETRKDWNLTQVEFAKRLGVTNAHISAIEKGKTIPSAALIKLICKEFKVSEEWLTKGVGPRDSEDFDSETENVLMDTSDRFNKILTRDNSLIRARVARIEKMFTDILEINFISEDERIEYLDLCHKLFFHLSSYIVFNKSAAEHNQLHFFSYPDDIIKNLEKDLGEFDSFFEKMEKK